MVFSSILFLFYFLPIAFLCYFAVPKKYRNFVLFVFSLFFYAWGEPVYVVIMLFSTAVDFFHGKEVDKALKKGNRKLARRFVASSMIINLCVLGFFKYADFVIGNINGLFGLGLPLLNLPLPIGISFYTFQTMSYTVDVYRGDAKVQNNIISFGTYVALFPQLIAGPIVRYKTVAEELNHRTESFDNFSSGVNRFLLGLGKKVLLANNIGLLWNDISSRDVSEVSVVAAWLGIIAYTFQIYFDFSGYSDMAIGLGRMMGFHFLENFNYPYVSKSITEFWRRWHISLSTWFKEYVYIPLGGNRHGKLKQLRNICIVWLLTGLWHGASWNFVAWGAYFGILLILEKLFLLRWLNKAPSWIGHVYTMFLVIISWALFAFDNFTQAFAFIRAMFGAQNNPLYQSSDLYLLYTNAVLLVILILASTEYPKKWAHALSCRARNWSVRWGDAAVFVCHNAYLLGVFILSIAYMVDASYNPFLYFRF
ncbi:MAG: MBOAT family O-acyltransferase [Massiliimalia sp.]|jgi:alginate O-acetyltransferase complex protein AlgI